MWPWLARLELKTPVNCKTLTSQLLLFLFFLPLLDEPVSSENLNGHATSSVTSEEVKVDIESPETLQEEQASALSTEDKTGTLTYAPACVQLRKHLFRS